MNDAFDNALKEVKKTAPKKVNPPRKAKAVTKPKAVPKPKTKDAPPPATQRYALGEKAYNPRVEHTAVAWEKVRGCLIANKDSHAELCVALAEHATKEGENHHDFIGYLVRRGAIARI